MSESKKKGDLLELAVEAIERNILEKHQGDAKNSYSITRNEIIVVDGTRHEIDVLVRMQPKTPYESLHAFECKNLKHAVGKSVVSGFADVVDQIKAAKGIIIARSFSRDAVALAKKHPRVELIEFGNLDGIKWECSHVSHRFTSFRVHLKFGNSIEPRDFPGRRNHSCVFQGKPDDFTEVCHGLMNERLKRLGVFDAADGKFAGSMRHVINLEPGELSLLGISVECLALDVDYEGSLDNEQPTTAISIGQRGGFVKFDFDRAKHGGDEMSLHIITVPRLISSTDLPAPGIKGARGATTRESSRESRG